MLYGENEQGEMETYLISYNAKHGTKLDVWTDGAAHTSFDPALLWSPLPNILSKADTEATVSSWAVADADAAADVTVTCRQGDLASLLMGSCQLEGMLRLGAASADNGEAAQQLSRLLHYGQKPWLNSDY